MNTIENRCRQFWAGLISEEEWRTLLDAMQVRGGIDATHFVGYDYIQQEWVEVDR